MQTLTKPNHTWLAYANQDKCNHVDAIHNLGFISWSMGRNYKFSIGDIVYIFMSDERRVRFKMQVEAEGIKREDMDYCISLLPEDITYRLRFVSEYNGNLLGETELIKRGFKGGRSIQKPTCKESEYMDFIKSVFDSIENTNSIIDEDFSFQLKIQEVNETACLTIGDYSKEEPKLGTGSGSLCVNKNAKVSKKALLSAKYTCAGNHNHITFETAKGQPYMEGHHLIPCTYANTKYYWDTLGVNIDCLENIVCLCPTCHRQIHYGSNKEKRILIEKLYNMKCKELKSVGITISLNDLFSLYSI